LWASFLIHKARKNCISCSAGFRTYDNYQGRIQKFLEWRFDFFWYRRKNLGGRVWDFFLKTPSKLKKIPKRGVWPSCQCTTPSQFTILHNHNCALNSPTSINSPNSFDSKSHLLSTCDAYAIISHMRMDKWRRCI